MSWQSETRAWGLAAAGLFCMGAIGYRVLTFPALPELGTTVRQLNATLGNLNAATGQWAAASKQQTASVSAIERDIRAELWHVDRSLTAVNGTLTAAQGAIGGMQTTLGVADSQLAHVGPLLDSARATTDALPPVLNASTQTLTDIDLRVSDPHIADLVNHADGMSASGDKMLADAQYKTHQILHPDKVKLGFWGALWAGIKAVHQIEPPIF